MKCYSSVLKMGKRRQSKKKPIEGDGIVDTAKEMWNRLKYLSGNRAVKPPKLQTFLNQYGDKRIVELRICRKPLNNWITRIGNVLTFGQLQQRVRQLGYDSIFHLFIWFRLENNSSFIIEKNQIIQVKPTPSDAKQSQFLPIPLQEPLTWSIIFQRLEQYIPHDRLYIYNVSSWNCQRWVMDVLQVNGLMSPERQAFVLQDAAALLKEGWLSAAAKDITDAAANLSIGIRGGQIDDPLDGNAILRRHYANIERAVKANDWNKKNNPYLQ